jgi:hypothetical protein
VLRAIAQPLQRGAAEPGAKFIDQRIERVGAGAIGVQQIILGEQLEIGGLRRQEIGAAQNQRINRLPQWQVLQFQFAEFEQIAQAIGGGGFLRAHQLDGHGRLRRMGVVQLPMQRGAQ